MKGFRIGLGLFFILICVVFVLFGAIGFGVLFVFALGIIMIVSALKDVKKDKTTSKKGERCYSRILDCVKTGNFVLSKEEYKVIVVAYIPSLGKRIFLEETVGYNCPDKYPKDAYLSILYNNGDMNVDKLVNESSIPSDVLKSITEESVEKEYEEYVAEKERKAKETERMIQDNVEKALPIIDKINLIIKRVIIGVIILILLFFIIIDSALFVQTIKAKDYIETTATYVEEKEDDVFIDCTYTFVDKKEETHEIVVSISKKSVPEQEIKIKYNENNPEDFYEESALLNKNGLIFYGIKIIGLILLVLLFFNKKLLDKISISVG